MEQQFKRDKDFIKTIDKSLLYRKIIGDTPNRTVINIYNLLLLNIEYCALQIFNGDNTYEEKMELLKDKVLKLQNQCSELCNTRNTAFYNDPEKIELMEEYFNYFFTRLLQVLQHGQIEGRDAVDSHPAEAISLDSELFDEEDVKLALESLKATQNACCAEDVVFTIDDSNLETYVTTASGPIPYRFLHNIPSDVDVIIFDFATYNSSLHLFGGLQFDSALPNGKKIKFTGNARFWDGSPSAPNATLVGRMSAYYYVHNSSPLGTINGNPMTEGFQELIWWNDVWYTNGY